MSVKKKKIEAMIQGWRGGGGDPHYAAFFECFNTGLFYEAHEVLEQLWLPQRKGPNDAFYKGLIQLAGAFVHLQKGRPGPARALFRLASANLAKYGSPHERLDVKGVLRLIREWQDRVERGERWESSTHNELKPRILLGD